MKIVKVKKGSTLALVMIVMAILTISGTAILSLSLSGLKYRSIEQNKKLSLYASESGINEAYMIIANYVNTGISEGNKAVDAYNNNLNKFLENELSKVNAKDSDYSSVYIDKSGNVNQTQIDSDRKTVFKEGYYGDENGNYTPSDKEHSSVKFEGYNDYILNLDNLNGLTQTITTNHYSTVSSADTIAMSVMPITGGSFPFNIELKSAYTANSISKTIDVTYKIDNANFNAANSAPNKLLKLPVAPFSKALVVGGDMILKDSSKCTVENSDIYVAGSDTGIDLEGNSSSLSIHNGSLITTKDVKLQGASSSLNVVPGSDPSSTPFSGNVYARNLLIDPSAPAATVTLGKMEDDAPVNNRDGSLYTMDDLELNGDRVIVDIAGNYNGVSDGSEGIDNDPDQSSSININASDIDDANGSRLTIGKNVCIAGTGYIGLDDNVKYQTGESVCIKGNYVAYTAPLSNTAKGQYDEENIIFDYLKPLTLASKFNPAYTSSDEVEVLLDDSNCITVVKTQKGNIDHPSSQYYSINYGDSMSPITLLGNSVANNNEIKVGTSLSVKLYDSLNGNGECDFDSPLTMYTTLKAFNKSDYFNYYAQQYGTDSSLTLSNNIKIEGKSINNINLGAVISNDASDKSTVSLSTYHSTQNYDNKIKAKRIQLKNQLFYMGMAEDMEDLSSSIENTQDTTNVTDILVVDGKTSPEITINNLVNFSKLNDYTGNNINANNEILYLNGNSSNTYVLRGSLDALSPNSYSGVIITSGNVEIQGNVEFKGMIICNGNVTFDNGSSLTLKYDYNYLKTYIINNCGIFSNILMSPDYKKYNSANYVDAFVFNYNGGDSGNNAEDNKAISMLKWELIK